MEAFFITLFSFLVWFWRNGQRFFRNFSACIYFFHLNASGNINRSEKSNIKNLKTKSVAKSNL